jgi:hypothetical protein
VNLFQHNFSLASQNAAVLHFRSFRLIGCRWRKDCGFRKDPGHIVCGAEAVVEKLCLCTVVYIVLGAKIEITVVD